MIVECVGTQIPDDVAIQLLPPVFGHPLIFRPRQVAVPEGRIQEHDLSVQQEVGAVGEFGVGHGFGVLLVEPLLRLRPLAPDLAHYLGTLLLGKYVGQDQASAILPPKNVITEVVTAFPKAL